jgi:hypothetical protein
LDRNGLSIADREYVDDAEEIVSGFGEGVPPLDNLD